MIDQFRDPIERSKFGILARLRPGRVALAASGVELVGVAASVATENATPLGVSTAILAISTGFSWSNLHNNRNSEKHHLGKVLGWLTKPDDQVLAERQQRRLEQ